MKADLDQMIDKNKVDQSIHRNQPENILFSVERYHEIVGSAFDHLRGRNSG